MEPWHHELGESHRDTCWEDNFTGSILSHLLVLQEMTGCPPGSAQQGSLAQTGMALPSSPEGWTLRCSFISVQRNPQQLLEAS